MHSTCTEASARERKRIDTARARVALWGGTLVTTDGDDGQPLYIITRWSLTRSFTSVAEVEAWLQRAGVPG